MTTNKDTADEDSAPLDLIPQPGEDSAVHTRPFDDKPALRTDDVSATSVVGSAATIDAAYACPATEEEIVAAELVDEPAAKPRVWTALLVGILAIPLAAVVGGVVLVSAMVASHGTAFLRGGAGMENWLEDFAQTRFGLMVLIVPGQLVFLAAALGAAWLSPQSLTRRLGLGRGGLPGWSWIVLMLGTPVIGVFSSHLLSLLVSDMSDQLKLVDAMMRTHVRDFPLGLLAIVAVLPGFVEELLFRGYLQSRLLRCWPPVLAVGFSALVFSVAHLDPVHVLGVIPLGLWLGTIAWRAGSIWPAILCHAINNAVAVTGAVFQDASTLELTLDPFSVTLLAVGGPAFLLSLGILARGGRGREDLESEI
jgi:hypothetical protein